MPFKSIFSYFVYYLYWLDTLIHFIAVAVTVMGGGALDGLIVMQQRLHTQATFVEDTADTATIETIEFVLTSTPTPVTVQGRICE